jgi:hypothetical protein
VTPSQPPLALTRRRQLQLVIVPALELALGFDVPAAVGTSLLVIAINSAAALISRLGGTPISTGRCAAVRRYRDRGGDRWRSGRVLVNATRLTVGLVVLLVAVASYTAARFAALLVCGRSHRKKEAVTADTPHTSLSSAPARRASASVASPGEGDAALACVSAPPTSGQDSPGGPGRCNISSP